jgi:serine/threonine protein kinase
VLRDIKPPNILLDAYDQPVFADFGIAVILQTTVHRGTSIAGTWNYMAPEAFEPQAFAEGIGKHTDMWALACVIVEMRTGQRPWADMQMQQISRAVCDQRRTPQVPDDAPAAALLRRCFVRRPTPGKGNGGRETPKEIETTGKSTSGKCVTVHAGECTAHAAEAAARTTADRTAKLRRRQWWNMSQKAVVSTVLVKSVKIRLLLHCRHKEGGKSRCRNCYRSILRGIAMRMRAHSGKSQLRAQS